MARILVVHTDRAARKFIEKRAGQHHVVRSTGNLSKTIKLIIPYRPEVIIAEVDPRRPGTLDLLRYLNRHHIKTPVILVGKGGAGMLQPLAMKMGASAFIEYPMEQAALDQAIARARQSQEEALGGVIPPITEEELSSNLSDLEERLNGEMVCFAGRNQVYIQSLITGVGETTKPRIALKCPVRKQFGYPPDVYYEFIRDICCGAPSTCPAYQEFALRSSA
jgi:FixJ family two-component response regulator